MQIDKYFHMYGRKDNIVFEEIPDPEQKWIPVSERLPEEGKCMVAVSCASNKNTCESFTAFFDGNRFSRSCNKHTTLSGVKAWMPLPEPYREEGD